MREIKFKYWDKRLKKFAINCPNYISVNNIKSFIDDYNFLQYTGYKDKNDTEIYEGDIINAFIIEDHIETMGTIVFDDYFLFYANKNLAGNTPLFKLNNIEVIGNIYENPELLKG